jgi:putative membrane protein
MYYLYYGIHFLLFFSYGVFFLQFIKSLEFEFQRKIFAILSLIFMVLLLLDGTKLILLNPAVAKSGGWLHVKLSIFIVVMLENVYFFITKRKFSLKFYEILYYLNYFLFIIIIVLAVFKPF